MNIIEAAKSGKRMRRDIWGSDYGWFDFKKESLEMDGEDILAEDWTVEPTIINRETIIGAWDVATYKEFDLIKIRDKLIDELGL